MKRARAIAVFALAAIAISGTASADDLLCRTPLEIRVRGPASFSIETATAGRLLELPEIVEAVYPASTAPAGKNGEHLAPGTCAFERAPAPAGRLSLLERGSKPMKAAQAFLSKQNAEPTVNLNAQNTAHLSSGASWLFDGEVLVEALLETDLVIRFPGSNTDTFSIIGWAPRTGIDRAREVRSPAKLFEGAP
jgi:hypothetical protein